MDLLFNFHSFLSFCRGPEDLQVLCAIHIGGEQREVCFLGLGVQLRPRLVARGYAAWVCGRVGGRVGS